MIYSIIITCFILLSLPVLHLHKKTRPGFKERFGFYGDKILPRGEPTIWLHGASAGDLLSISPMIRLLKKRFPRGKLIVSAMTDTGEQIAKTRMKDEVDQFIFVPWDTPSATRRAMSKVKPDLLVLEYAEIWPNLIQAAKRIGAKVVVTNGRFADKNMKGYRWLFSLTGNPLKQVDCLLMREDEEAERVIQLGAPKDRVLVTGNTKFDALIPKINDAEKALELRQALDFPEDAPVLIAGSTHEGEEPLIIQVYQRLLARHPDLRLAIAPRYINRAGKIMDAAKAAGFSPRLRSTPIDANSKRQTQITVMDTIGELTRAYALATVVFVGGSFCRRGGQNILEPAAQGRPVLFGPNMDNFKDSVRLLVGRGGIQVSHPDHLFTVLNELLDKPEEISVLGDLALKTVSSIRGASQRNVDAMEKVLGAKATNALTD